MSNMLTFDIEEWYHANYEHVKAPVGGAASNFRRQMEELLELCRSTGSKATFFVLGCIGETYPDIVRAIVRDGHELASHGYSHELAYKQTYSEFKADVKKSVDILEHTAGYKIMGYRAPSWSIIKQNLHYLEALEELGFTYDASIFPVRTFLYGIPDAPTCIHRPVVNGRELGLYEVPMSVLRLASTNVGYSGGFYFRLLPAKLIKSAIRAANLRGESSIVYLHPREIDAGEQRLDLPFKERLIHYYNIGGTKRKLESVMRSFAFTSIASHLDHRGLLHHDAAAAQEQQ